jgi:hypothetical protein
MNFHVAVAWSRAAAILVLPVGSADLTFPAESMVDSSSNSVGADT